MINKKFGITLIVVLLLTVELTEAKKRTKKKSSHSTANKDKDKDYNKKESKQIFSAFQTKETNQPNFVRLVLMRLAYGLASSMGLEDRLSGVLNGAFVPPNADDDYGDLGFDFGGGDDGGGLFDDGGGLFDDGGGIFDDF